MNNYNDNLKYVLENFLVFHIKGEITLERYDVDDVLVEEGQDIDSFTIVLSGKAKVIQSYENGKRLLIQFVNPINILGDIEYITKSNATCTVVATEKIVCFKVKYKTLDERYKDNIVFSKFLLKHICRELLNSSTRNSINIVYPVKTRLASYLLSTINEANISKIVSMSDLSDYLGTSYRHLSRSINDLIDEGVIEKNKKQIKVVDFDMLKKIARGNIYEDD